MIPRNESISNQSSEPKRKLTTRHTSTSLQTRPSWVCTPIDWVLYSEPLDLWQAKEPPKNLRSSTRPMDLHATPERRLSRWREHFEATLNHPPGAPSSALDAEAAATTPNSDISTDMPTLDEVSRAISNLRNGRAAGPDGIPPELVKCAIGPVSKALHSLFCQVWTSGLVPSDWRDGVLVALYKGKGARTECSNYRLITLLSVPGKVLHTSY